MLLAIESVGEILWPGERLAREWSDGMKRAVHDCPVIRSTLLPEDFCDLSPGAQLQTLRTTLDENEWRPGVWPVKLRQAERWIEGAVSTFPSARSTLSELNRKRLQVIELGEQNGWTKSETAQVLSISRSHFSQILRRGRHRGPTSQMTELLVRLGFNLQGDWRARSSRAFPLRDSRLGR